MDVIFSSLYEPRQSIQKRNLFNTILLILFVIPIDIRCTMDLVTCFYVNFTWEHLYLPFDLRQFMFFSSLLSRTFSSLAPLMSFPSFFLSSDSPWFPPFLMITSSLFPPCDVLIHLFSDPSLAFCSPHSPSVYITMYYFTAISVFPLFECLFHWMKPLLLPLLLLLLLLLRWRSCGLYDLCGLKWTKKNVVSPPPPNPHAQP